MTIKEAKADEDSTSITIGLPRSVLNTIREVRFFDAKNTAIEARRSGSGYMNEKAEVEFQAKTKDKTVTLEFELWQNPRTVKVPFNVEVGLGVAASGRTVGSGESPASDANAKRETSEKREKPNAPPPVINATDGAASIEAVVKQMQTAAASGKGAQVLSVIYPSDRGSYGQGVAMALAFLPLGSMDDKKGAEQLEKEVDAFFEKHQLKPPFTRAPEELFKGIDISTFVSDALVFLKSHVKKGDKPGDTLPVPSGRPENVTTTGDTAVATLAGKECKFTRVSGRWFIRLE
jgi:hypothetical protein